MSRTRLVVVTQPYLPAYRAPLFQSISEKLSTNAVELVVATGRPSGDQAARGDAVSAAWHTSLDERVVSVMRRHVRFRKLPTSLQPDLVVSELEAANMLAWRQRWGGAKTVLWGHGKPYVNDGGWVSDRLEWALARKAEAVMTYTEKGREYLIDRGRISPDRVVAIGNSTDSAALRAAYLSVTPQRQGEIIAEVGRGPRALFVGGLDASKRIDFVLDAARIAHELDPSFKLIVVGRGEASSRVREAAGPHGPIVYREEARGEELAELAHVASSIWMPGRVGLVAVDALALGLPVYTTDYRYHAPEIDFLNTEQLQVLPDDAEGFARAALQPRPELQLPSVFPTIESVSRRFADVVLRALDE